MQKSFVYFDCSNDAFGCQGMLYVRATTNAHTSYNIYIRNTNGTEKTATGKSYAEVPTFINSNCDFVQSDTSYYDATSTALYYNGKTKKAGWFIGSQAYSYVNVPVNTAVSNLLALANVADSESIFAYLGDTRPI